MLELARINPSRNAAEPWTGAAAKVLVVELWRAPLKKSSRFNACATRSSRRIWGRCFPMRRMASSTTASTRFANT